MADTRKDRRAPVSLKVRFKSATVDEFIEHYCKDVSRGGIFIKSSQPMAIGTLLKFQFQLKDESSLIKGVGRVVWTRSPEDAVADQPAGMGIKFIKMDNESKAIVDRIVDSQGDDDGGAFDEGRATATQAETPSERPHASTDNFFPEGEPAELPPPEDRTAVRQAAQFLAAAFAEGGTDKAAAREAEQKAEEARQRTAQIEAQRQADSQRKGAPAVSGPSSLPSMIVDPTLGAKEGKPLTIPPDDGDNTPTTMAAPTLPSEPSPRAAANSMPPGDASRPSAPGLPSSLPPAEPSKKSPLIPAAVLVGILAVAAWAYQRKPAEVETPPATPSEPSAAVEPTAKPPEPLPVAPEPTAPEPEAIEAPDAGVEPAAPIEPAVEQKLVEVEIKAVPADAEVWLAGELKGKVPLKLQLPEGALSSVTVRAPGHAESTQEVTPTADTKKPVRFTLLALPYVVRVNTTPPDAKITVGAKHGNAGEEIVLGTALKGMLGITARLPGYEVLRAPLKIEDFTQGAESMTASVNLTLNPAPAAPTPPPKPRVRLAPPDAGSTSEPAATPAVEPAAAPATPDANPAPPAEKPSAAPVTPTAKPEEKPPAAAPVAPTPAPAPAPTPAPVEKKPAEPEKLPENPFG
jgi:uncharacterized protein (TIGR02266 family)